MNKTLAFYIFIIYKNFVLYTTQRFKEIGLNYGQIPFIVYIGKSPGCTSSELTQNLKMDWGHSQRSVTKLVETGFVVKEQLPDSRAAGLYLTPKGQDAFSLSHEVFSGWDQEIMKNLTSEEKQQLLVLLKKLTKKNEGNNFDGIISLY